MENIITKLAGGKLLIQLNKTIYEKDAVTNAAYKMTDSCHILVKPTENGMFNVYFEPKKNESETELEKIAKEFCNEILDMQVRLDIEKRYGNIRDLIIQQAFSPIENIKDKIKI
ncbi:MAG: His-Xaa-Ser system protein HxsD [Nitrospirae bacterium]|nr:His-Xaa-Ser system protein HxsD [Nitrospirota bacterium]